LGFIFYPKSPRYIEYAAAARVIAKLPAGVWKVGVFVDEPAAAVAGRAAEIGLDVAQLHGRETALDFPAGVRVWKALRVPPRGPLPDCTPYPSEAILLDGAASGQSFDWRLARNAGVRVILAPHHGSATSSTWALVQAAAPDLAVISAGRGNRYGHPHAAVLARYRAIGALILRTDLDGAVSLRTDGRSVEVQTFTGRRLTLRPGPKAPRAPPA